MTGGPAGVLGFRLFFFLLLRFVSQPPGFLASLGKKIKTAIRIVFF